MDKSGKNIPIKLQTPKAHVPLFDLYTEISHDR